jgi:hypothetical protein
VQGRHTENTFPTAFTALTHGPPLKDNGTQWPLCSSAEGRKLCPQNAGGHHDSAVTPLEDSTNNATTLAQESTAVSEKFTQPLTLLTDPKARCMGATPPSHSCQHLLPTRLPTHTRNDLAGWLVTPP